MDIDSALVTGNFDFGMQFQCLASFIILPRLGVEFFNLAQYDRPAILLPHLHRIAFQRRPELMKRVFIHRMAYFKPVLWLPAIFLLEFWQNACVICQLVAG